MTIHQDFSNEKKEMKKGISIWRILFRWLLVLLIGIALGVLLYYSVLPFIKQVSNTVFSNQNDISEMQNEIEKIQLQLDERLPQYNERITGLESDSELDEETLAELKADLQTAEKNLERQQKKLENLDRLDSTVASLSTSVSASSSATPAATPYQDTTELNQLSHHIEMLRAAELLSRSRIYLLQHNYGLAVSDIENAHTILTTLQENALQNETLMLSMEIDKLDAAISFLPEAPVQASAEIEAAWEMLVIGMSEKNENVSLQFGTAEISATPSPPMTIEQTDEAHVVTSTTDAVDQSQGTPRPGATPTR